MVRTWLCPFCGQYATITESNVTSSSGAFVDGNRYGHQYVTWTSTSCPNPSCREYALEVQVRDTGPSGKQRHRWSLLPPAQMKVLPNYVPEPIVADYREACAIAELSPKASATLSRRCLQGMIRDFWNIRKARLYDEVLALEEKVDPDTWAAIDGVRTVGNIGAHMEKDINVIVDVEPEEARLLIGLLETLVEDWYVVRYQRQERLKKVAALAAKKGAEKAAETT